jgi:hypothetical protein
MLLGAFAKRRGLASQSMILAMAAAASFASGYAGGRSMMGVDIAGAFFVAFMATFVGLFGLFVALREVASRATLSRPISQQGGSVHDQLRFRAGLAAVGIWYVGICSTFVTRGHIPLAPSSCHTGIVIGLTGVIVWTVAGIHVILPRMLDGTMFAWKHAFHVVIVSSAVPAVLGLAMTVLTGNRLAGLFLAFVSLLFLWLETRRLEKAGPDLPVGEANS